MIIYCHLVRLVVSTRLVLSTHLVVSTRLVLSTHLVVSTRLVLSTHLVVSLIIEQNLFFSVLVG